MLAAMTESQLNDYFSECELRTYTERTLVSEEKLRVLLRDVGQTGYAIVEEELEIGLQSIAVPVRGASGAVVAALNIATQTTRVTRHQLEHAFLPTLLNAASELSVLLP